MDRLVLKTKREKTLLFSYFFSFSRIYVCVCMCAHKKKSRQSHFVSGKKKEACLRLYKALTSWNPWTLGWSRSLWSGCIIRFYIFFSFEYSHNIGQIICSNSLLWSLSDLVVFSAFFSGGRRISFVTITRRFSAFSQKKNIRMMNPLSKSENTMDFFLDHKYTNYVFIPLT